MTQLEATNLALLAVDQEPLTDVSELDTVHESILFNTQLDQVQKDILSEGWKFNEVASYTYTPDVNGDIILTGSELEIVPAQSGVVEKEGKLYDTLNQTFTFESDQSAQVIFNALIQYLPEKIANYIVRRAIREFQMNTVGDQLKNSVLAQNEGLALVNAKKYRNRLGKTNALTGTFGSDYGFFA